MYGFHKVNDSSEQPVPPTTGSTPDPQQQEIISIWEFKHYSGYFKKGDLENLKNIKRRSSKNIAREINVKHIDRVQNYIPKAYDDEDFGADNNEIMTRLNELNQNYNTIKNDHINLAKKYDLAIEDLKKTNFDLITILDLIKDISNNSNKDLDVLVGKMRSNILARNVIRENEFANIPTLGNYNVSNLTSAPAMAHQNFSRVNSFDSSRDSIFMNKDIRYSSVSSSKRHQSILYDPLTVDPFQSRHNSNPEIVRQQPPPPPQHQLPTYSPISPGQPSLLQPLPPPPPPHYFQEHHQTYEHLPSQPPAPAPPPHQHHAPHQHPQTSAQPPQHHLHPPFEQNISNTSVTSYNSNSSVSIPSANVKNYIPQRQESRITDSPSDSSVRQSLPPHSQSSIGLPKLQPPFENGDTLLRRGRSDSVSDRVLFKRSKS